ncbi:hypothetical protein [Streptomyces sp. 1331.2]|uniref:hypothetical protein n=1 Tax=Streptomyces sp. 1331.2 TaxID=1938835 RepID=UPI000BD9EA69|nr:hypothetical protein [Streptomyces sp. 1331.2]SOB81093.1 hypothetical protein SAMN06272789_1282 [Streptomyces sp. 1331.2]
MIKRVVVGVAAAAVMWGIGAGSASAATGAGGGGSTDAWICHACHEELLVTAAAPATPAAWTGHEEHRVLAVGGEVAMDSWLDKPRPGVL